MSSIRWVSVVAFALWLAITTVEYEYVAALRHAWGLGLLRYLPDWMGWLFAGAALLFTTEEVRRGAIHAAGATASRLATLTARQREGLIFLVALALFWALRERTLFGDSQMLVSVLLADERLAFPEQGAQLLVRGVLRGARALGAPAIATLQVLVCVCGAGTLVALSRLARRLAPAGSGAAVWVVALMASAGLPRVFAGRVELVPLVLAATIAYLTFATGVLAGHVKLRTAALSLGVAAWLDPFCLLLAPSLAILVRGSPAREAAWALLPPVLGGALVWASGPADSGLGIGTLLGRLVDLAPQGWVGAPGTETAPGTAYALLSAGHSKYLANAAFVLAPFALPVWVFALVRRRAGADSTDRLLLGAAAPVLLGALLVRPIWGPFDWDRFAVTSFCLSAHAARLLVASGEPLRLHAAAAITGLQLFFVGAPLLVVGASPPPTAKRALGPFAQGLFDVHLAEDDARNVRRDLKPWL